MADTYPTTSVDFDALVERNATTMRLHSAKPAAIGDVWFRVDGGWKGDDEVYDGMELRWTTWRCTKTTPRGAWFSCIEWRANKVRFVLTSGARNLHRTKREALESLVRRKRRHIAIVQQQQTEAEETMQLARAELATLKALGEPS